MGTIISPVQGAVIAVRKTLAGIFPADTKVRDLTDVQIEWILGAGLGGWIDARISTGILTGSNHRCLNTRVKPSLCGPRHDRGHLAATW